MLGFFARSFFGCSIDADLLFHFHPIERERSVRIFFELPALFAGVIRVKNKTVLIETLQENDAHRRLSIRRSGGEGHRIRVANVSCDRGSKPTIELLNGIWIEIGAAQTFSDVLVTKTGDIERRRFHL